MTSYAYAPIEIVKGADFVNVITFNTKDCDTDELTPINLSSLSSISGELLDLEGNTLTALTCAVVNASAGIVSVSIPSETTATLVGSNNKKQTEKIGSYWVMFNWISGLNELKRKGPVSLTEI